MELDRRRLDDRIRGPRVEAEVVFGLEVVVAEADAARVDVPGRSDAAELRDVDVTAGEQVGARAGEGIRRVLGENDGRRSRPATRGSRAVRRPSRSTATVASKERRYSTSSAVSCERLHSRCVSCRSVVTSAPASGSSRKASEFPAPRGPPRCAGARGTRPAAGRPGHVPEGDDEVGASPLDVVERRAQPDGVPVRVRDQGDAHVPSGGGRGTRAGRSG